MRRLNCARADLHLEHDWAENGSLMRCPGVETPELLRARAAQLIARAEELEDAAAAAVDA